MPFIGNQPALSYTSFAKQDFTTSATTSYTLDNPVANANELALFINFVRQEPTTAYSASGTNLILTSATSASDDMYCVYLGKAVQTVNPPNASVGTAQLSDTSVTPSKLNLNDNLLFNTASKGIYLGTTSATAANLLDDYEEGTWSPSIATGTATINHAYYTKIGRQVTITFDLENLSDSSSSNPIKIGNLPFSKFSTFEFTGSCHGERVATTFRAIVPYLNPGDNNVGYRVPGGTTNFEALLHSDVNDGTDFAMRTQLVYFTT